MGHWIKSLALILGAALPVSLGAQTGLKPNQRWVAQVDAGFSIPPIQTNPAPGRGYGGDINFGYRFSRTLTLFIGTGYYQYDQAPTFTSADAKLAYIPLTGILRLTFGDGPFRPYVFGGVGIAFNTYSQTNLTGSPAPQSSFAETDFYLAPGAGILYVFASDMAFFLQARVDLDYTTSSGLGLALDTPSVFIPFQVGISFFAY